MKASMKLSKNLLVGSSIKTVILLAGICTLLLTPAGVASERAEADVVCDGMAEPLQHTCTFRLYERSSGQAITGAKIVIDADMPDMPMAHNVRPVIATESETPGSYQATILLEMRGQWVLRLTISGPMRDVVIVAMDLGGHSDH